MKRRQMGAGRRASNRAAGNAPNDREGDRRFRPEGNRAGDRERY